MAISLFNNALNYLFFNNNTQAENLYWTPSSYFQPHEPRNSPELQNIIYETNLCATNLIYGLANGARRRFILDEAESIPRAEHSIIATSDPVKKSRLRDVQTCEDQIQIFLRTLKMFKTTSILVDSVFRSTNPIKVLCTYEENLPEGSLYSKKKNRILISSNNPIRLQTLLFQLIQVIEENSEFVKSIKTIECFFGENSFVITKLNSQITNLNEVADHFNHLDTLGQIEDLKKNNDRRMDPLRTFEFLKKEMVVHKVEKRSLEDHIKYANLLGVIDMLRLVWQHKCTCKNVPVESKDTCAIIEELS